MTIPSTHKKKSIGLYFLDKKQPLLIPAFFNRNKMGCVSEHNEYYYFQGIV